jgi:hypothetical protein
VGRAYRAAHRADRGIEITTLELPEGYTLKPMDPSEESSRMLVLKRSDGSSVVRFEFSALGPGPLRSYELAAEGSLIHDHHPRSSSTIIIHDQNPSRCRADNSGSPDHTKLSPPLRIKPPRASLSP